MKIKTIKLKTFSSLLPFYFLFSISCFLPAFHCYAEYTGEILNLEIGGRALGLAGAYTSITDPAFASWWNPAGILQSKGTAVGAMRGREFGLFNFNCIGIGISQKDLKVGSSPNIYVINNVAAGLIFGTMGIDSIPELPDTLVSQPIGYFGANEQVILFTIAYSPELPREIKGKASLGANIKYLKYNIYNTQANGVGIDIGTNYKYKNLLIGAVIKDIGGTNIKWQTNKQDRRPTSVIIGAAYHMMDALLGVADLGYEYNKPFYKVGFEYALWNLMALRMGIGKGISFGVGAKPQLPEQWTYGKLKNLNIDYAFSVKDLGAVSNISLTLSF